MALRTEGPELLGEERRQERLHRTGLAHLLGRRLTGGVGVSVSNGVRRRRCDLVLACAFYMLNMFLSCLLMFCTHKKTRQNMTSTNFGAS